MMQVAIIGSAGRNVAFSRALFEQMCASAERVIRELGLVPANVILVSGGAVGADAVAVRLWNEGKVGGLVLHLPCPLDAGRGRFADNGATHWTANPGRTANYYHDRFRAASGIDSLAELSAAIARGATIGHCGGGFHGRNRIVAQCPFLIAFSPGETEPRDGGTLDTWRQCNGRRVFVPIG